MNDLETLRPEVREAWQRIVADEQRPEDFECVQAELLRLSGSLTARQTIDAISRAERAEAELVEARETIKRLLGQNKVQYDFLSSRQCPDHAGKWERGKCLQCALEKAEGELAEARETIKRLNLGVQVAEAAQAQTAYFIGGPHATAIVHNLHHADRVIEALCECTGDDVDDYTVTDLSTTS